MNNLWNKENVTSYKILQRINGLEGDSADMGWDPITRHWVYKSQKVKYI